jgi:hypothetical protein
LEEIIMDVNTKRTQSAARYLSKERGGAREALGYAWKITVDGETYQCFCNGFTGFFLKNFIDIPEREEPALKDFWKLIPNRRDLVECEFSRSDVEVARKLHKTSQVGIKKKLRTVGVYKVGNSFYNIDYIVDCINILGGDIIFKNNPNNPFGIALLESENGMAILLPRRKGE